MGGLSGVPLPRPEVVLVRSTVSVHVPGAKVFPVAFTRSVRVVASPGPSEPESSASSEFIEHPNGPGSSVLTLKLIPSARARAIGCSDRERTTPRHRLLVGQNSR